MEQKFTRKLIFVFPKYIYGTGSKLTFYMSPILTLEYFTLKNSYHQDHNSLHSTLDVIYRLTRWEAQQIHTW